MDKLTAIATLVKLGETNPSVKKFTDKIINELEDATPVAELEKVKLLFRNGSAGELLTNSLILAVKQENIKVVIVNPNEVISEVVVPVVKTKKAEVMPNVHGAIKVNI